MAITLETRNLKKVYQDAHYNRTTIFEDMNLTLEAGKLYAVFGASGCGKSTLLHMLGLLDRPTSGEVLVMGEKTYSLSEAARADLRRDRIGFVFQTFYLDFKMDVAENMKLPLRINKKIQKKEYESHIRKLLSLFGVEEFEHRYPSELSGGEQQRVCIARAIANDPDIILADEPTGNLDEENGQIVLEYLKQVADSGKTVVIVSHDDRVKQYADIVYQLKKGILEKEEPQE